MNVRNGTTKGVLRAAALLLAVTWLSLPATTWASLPTAVIVTVAPVISANNSDATVHLDGTHSVDADGDALTYVWFVDGSPVPVATGAPC